MQIPLPIKAPPHRGGPLLSRFVSWHELNPHVLDHVIDIALDLRSKNWSHGSVNLIYERLRWLYAVHTMGDSYKLNNSFRSYHARLAMMVEPALNGWFRTRRVDDPEVERVLWELVEAARERRRHKLIHYKAQVDRC